MKALDRFWRGALLCLGLALLTVRVHAIIFLSTGDPNHNTTAPTGSVTNSGWQWQSTQSVCATAVGPHHLLTVAHLGVTKQNRFHFGGLEYFVTASSNVPNADLTVVWVGGRLPSWAPLYRSTDELNARLVFHGIGGARGDPVYLTNGTPQLRGWLWTVADGRLRWGTNSVDATSVGGSDLTDFLVCQFRNRSGTDIATFSVGDSGGGAFLKDTDGAWKLAGVVSRVESQYRYTPDGETINAALYDRRQFYEFTGSAWSIDASSLTRPASIMLASRVTVAVPYIDQAMAQVPDGTDTPQLFAAATPGGPFMEINAYAVDPTNRVITAIAPSAATQFFILKGIDHVGAVQISGDKVLVHY